jgi:hypothetical protein
MNEWMTDEKMDESISEWVLVMVKKKKKTPKELLTQGEGTPLFGPQ